MKHILQYMEHILQYLEHILQYKSFLRSNFALFSYFP
jgi:uncharacterized protein with HEPN domain